MSEKINVMLTTENMEQLQMAAMVASVGAVSGNDVSVFLSMNALKYFVKENNHKAPVEGEMGNIMLDKKVPPFLELFEQAVELGDAKVYPCSMAMDMLEVKSEDLFDYVGEPMGLTKFLSDVNQGQVWSF
jgi:peroxiredoxin family protein|tara:strand:- start:1868 stop:2257 length:390 start_codon:yes stop_codon:yes gene_type:complete